MSSSPGMPRPLPARPSLEFERKRAKKLLRELKLADATAKLADAQYQVAREYGFLSWPRLVEYFETVERHDRSRRHDEGYEPAHFEQQAQQTLRRLHARADHVLDLASAFVPRFYGAVPDNIPAAELTLDDARLIVARGKHCPSWDILIERARKVREQRPEGWKQVDSPFSRASRALHSGDFDIAGAIIGEHPGLLGPATRDEPSRPGSLVGGAIFREWKNPGPETRRVTDWLVSRGASLRAELGRLLIDAHHYDLPTRAPDGTRIPETRTRAEYVAFLLERGADPTWMPPNGISVLEHALLRYQDPAATDLIARRVEPRKAFWIAAGLGDIRAVARYVNRDGSLTDAARRDRPDFLAAHVPVWWTQLPAAPDRDIVLEAFFVAAMNQRWAVMDLLLERGFPIDYSPWGTSIAPCFFSPPSVPQVEYFVSRGANLDLTMGDQAASIRDWARMLYASHPSVPGSRRILELCGGGDPAEAVRELEAQLGPPKPAIIGEHLEKTFALARDDARRLGQTTVEPHNLFVGLLRGERTLPLAFVTGEGGADLARLRALLGHRLVPFQESHVTELPLSAESRSIIEAATAAATERRSPYVTVLHILQQLVTADSGPVAELIAGAGGSAAYVRGSLKGAI